MTLNDVKEFVKRNSGRTISTIGGRRQFTVEQRGEKAFAFVINQGKERNESHAWIQKSLDVFNASGSLKAKDYPHTRNSSYVLAMLSEIHAGKKTLIQSELLIGKIYTWNEVQTNWFGEETFLAKRDGKIVCATLDREQNPFAPDIMVVGEKPKNMQRAEEFCRQRGSIPVFIKEAPNQWRYSGRFEIANVVTDAKKLRAAEPEYGRGLTRIIFLRPENGETPPEDVDDDALSRREGRKKWVQHLRRERNRGLVAAKKKTVLAKQGRLACETCDFDFLEFYGPDGKDFCEVHHRKPLADLLEEVETSLEDLAVICSNCHRVIHRIKPMPSVEAFRTAVKLRNPHTKNQN